MRQVRGLRAIAILAGLGTLLLPLPTLIGSANSSIVTRFIFYSPAMAYGLWMILRVARTGVRATPSMMIIVNPVRTYRMPWDKIERFESGRFGLVPKVAVRLKSGRSIGIFGLPSSSEERTQSVIYELEDMTARACSSGVNSNNQGQTGGHVTPWWWFGALAIPALLVFSLVPTVTDQLVNRDGMIATVLVSLYGFFWLAFGWWLVLRRPKKSNENTRDFIRSLQGRLLLVGVMASMTSIWGFLGAAWSQSLLPGLVGAVVTIMAIIVVTPWRSRLAGLSSRIENEHRDEMFRRFGHRA